MCTFTKGKVFNPMRTPLVQQLSDKFEVENKETVCKIELYNNNIMPFIENGIQIPYASKTFPVFLSVLCDNLLLTVVGKYRSAN